MDLRILTATIQAARVASDCGESAAIAARELENACASYDGSTQSVQSSNRIYLATERLSARCAAFSRCADAAYDATRNICKG